MEQAFKAVQGLVKDFRENERNYLSPSYQESHVRQDFIDKFFFALGWDVTHERQKNPHEYEVRIENRVPGSGTPAYRNGLRRAGTQQRADYAFFLAPNFRDPKFFVEAKKPARQLENPDFFYQTIRYGWNGNTPIAILTDFEEFHVIDCRLKPTIKDALSRRIQSFRYPDYADEEKFVWIYYLFSHEAVADNSIEKFASKLSKPKGKAVRGVSRSQPVDEVFLAELDGYRESLAKAFKKSNQELDGEELTEAVQRTIDRLVFTRFLEDKLIEEKEVANFGARKLGWELFLGHCRKLEPKYNGLIFKPHPVIDSEKFNSPDEEVFREVCDGLAGPDSPYNFDQIPISILGSIYERFLGKVVHATEKRVKVEDKPEVRKAGGVYYTPDYIVRYIVKETVGKMIEGKTPEEISKMAFADIACGSGSFLIEVYNTLLEYHERYYTEHPEKAKKGDVEQREGRKVLSLKKRQEILTNNIYGVDIDYQATEVTQLSLYLKLLEDVTTNDAYQFSLLKEKILPDLRNNIVCGNSLIGKDIMEGDLFPDIDESKLKPMNFEDAFPEVMKGDGFDAVVGNPPYVRQELLGQLKSYFQSHFKAYSGAADLYVYFFERAHHVLRRGGLFGMICSNKFIRSNYGKGLRDLLKSNAKLLGIIDFGELPVFDGPATFPAIFLTQNEQVREQRFDYAAIKRLAFTSLDSEVESVKEILDSKSLEGDNWTLASREEIVVFDKMRQSSASLEAYTEGKVYFGIKTGMNEAFVIDEQTRRKLIKEDRKCEGLIKPFAVGDDVRKYHINFEDRYLILLPNGWTKAHCHGSENPWDWFAKNYPSLARHLSQFTNAAKERYDQGEYWWELRPCDYYPEFAKPKIIYPDIAKESRVAFDIHGLYLSNTIYFIPKDDLYLLGILNSKLIFSYFKRQAAVLGDADKGGRLRWFRQDVLKLPIRKVDPGNPKEDEMRQKLVKLVERMLAAKEELSKAKTEAKTTRLERECEALDRQIDQAVYELYGLTEEEKKIVEGKE